jgi:hypothetical protein
VQIEEGRVDAAHPGNAGNLTRRRERRSV